MAKKKVTSVVEDLLQDFLTREGYELYSSEFVKEGGDWFLRVYIDLPPDEEGRDRYVSTEDCEKVSRFLSEALDQTDPIDQNYYLEVSSPGMDRPLLTEAHYRRYIGRQVEIRLYRGKDGTKNITGTLDSYESPDQAKAGDQGPVITVTDENGRKWILNESEIARTRLAVIF